MKLTVTRSKNSATYYVQKSYRTDTGKCSTKTVERLGTLEELKVRFGEADPIGAAKQYIAELTAAEKAERQEMVIRCKPSLLLSKGDQRSYNGGHLFLQKVYHDLGLHKICDTIVRKQHKESKNHDIKYDLNEILSRLLYTRIMYLGSMLSSMEDARRFIEQPKCELHQIYRALSLLSRESDFIQAQVYKNSLKLGERNTKVLYYDCTNYFFESEEESGLRQYGHSKENRPNPIVQMGLFMDMDGFPLAFCINPGNANEQITLKPLEQKINDEFHISKLIVCTDLDGPAPAILKANSRRWMIENCFRTMKTDFDARPVYLQRDDRIRAHFLTCFLALLLYKYLEKKTNRGGNHFSTEEIISTLSDMNFLAIQGEGYIPTYTRTDLTNALHGSGHTR